MAMATPRRKKRAYGKCGSSPAELIMAEVDWTDGAGSPDRRRCRSVAQPASEDRDSAIFTYQIKNQGMKALPPLDVMKFVAGLLSSGTQPLAGEPAYCHSVPSRCSW